MITYIIHPAQYPRIDCGKTIHSTHSTLFLSVTGKPCACLWELTFNPGGMEIKRRMHTLMEKKIKGVRYKVHSSYVGETSFRTLYEKCLASRTLRLCGENCADGAAGD